MKKNESVEESLKEIEAKIDKMFKEADVVNAKAEKFLAENKAMIKNVKR